MRKDMQLWAIVLLSCSECKYCSRFMFLKEQWTVCCLFRIWNHGKKTTSQAPPPFSTRTQYLAYISATLGSLFHYITLYIVYVILNVWSNTVWLPGLQLIMIRKALWEALITTVVFAVLPDTSNILYIVSLTHSTERAYIRLRPNMLITFFHAGD